MISKIVFIHMPFPVMHMCKPNLP